MVLTKKEEKKYLKDASEALTQLKEKIMAASDENLIQLLNKSMKWDTSKGTLYHWIPVLNKFDALLEGVINKYGLSEKHCKPQEMNTFDTNLVCAILAFTHMLLENCLHRGIYSSSHRLYDLLNCPSISVCVAVLRCYVVLARKFINQRPKMFIGQRKVSERIYTLGVFLPASSLTANTGSSTTCSLVDYIKEEPQIPKKWKSLNYIYCPEEAPRSHAPQNQIEGSPSIKRVKDLQSPKKKKPSKLASGETIETLHIAEHDVRKLTLQQMFDKGVAKVPPKVWPKFAYTATMAKAFNSNSYENIKLRQDLVVLKSLSIAFLVMVNRELEITSKVFECDPTLLTCLIDLVNLQNNVPTEVRLAAATCLECIASKKTWSTEIMRGLGGSVSHGLLFQILKSMAKQLKIGIPEQVSENYNSVIFHLVLNLASTKTLASSLVSAGLIQHLSEFLTIPTQFKITSAGATHLLQNIVTSSSENIALFKENKGFQKLLSSITSEIEFALHDKMGGPPLLSIVHYTISYPQCYYLIALLRFALGILQKESGDTVRNLFDSSLLNDINKILLNIPVFGLSLLSNAINIVSAILHNEPTSYTILKEAGTIDVVIDNFGDFLRPSKDVVCALPNLIGAVSLNNNGLERLKQVNAIKQFFKIFEIQGIARDMVSSENYEFLVGAIDELARHYPDFKPLILDELCALVEKLADGTLFEFPRPHIYRSELKSFYHSKEEPVVDNEEGSSELDVWENIDEAYTLEFAASVIGSLVELGGFWHTMYQKIAPEVWVKLVVLKNSPFDYVYSNAMYPINGALKYFDDTSRAYGIYSVFDKIVETVDAIDWYCDSSEKQSLFQALENQDDFDKADDLFNGLIAVNNALFGFVDVFCNSDSLSPTRCEQLCKLFGTDGGCNLIDKLGKLLQRVTWEEHALRTSMPPIVSEETVIKEYDDGFPPTRIFDNDANVKLKFDKTSAKFKNACQVRLVGHRIHSSIAIIFNTLLMLANMSTDEQLLDTIRWQIVRIAGKISEFFVSLLCSNHFANADVLLILLYTMHYCFTDSHNDNVLTLPAILFVQKGGLLKEREVLGYFWREVSSLDPTKISEVKELAYVKNTKESITISIILNCLVFFNKLTDFNQLTNVPYPDKFYESNFHGYAIVRVNDFRSNLLVQTKLFGFGVLENILEGDETSDVKELIPEDVFNELIKFSKNIFTASEEKHLQESDGSLFSIDWRRLEHSLAKADYLKDLGVSEADVAKSLAAFKGSLTFLKDDIRSTLPTSPADAVMKNASATPYTDYVPSLAEPQFSNYHTLVELQELRESELGAVLDGILSLVQVHPTASRLVSQFLIGTFLDAPGASIEEFESVILRLVLDYIESFDLSVSDNKGLAGLLNLFSFLILNDTVFFSCHSILEEFSDFVIDQLKPEYVNADWFDDAVLSMVKIISGTQLPSPVKLGPERPFIGIFKEPPIAFKLEKAAGDRLFDIAVSVSDISSTDSALALCRLLTIYAGDPRYANKVSQSGVVEKILKAISYPKLKEPQKPYILQTAFMYLVRRCYETTDIITDMAIREIKTQYTNKSRKELKSKSRELSSVLKDCYGVIMRNPDIFVEEISKRVRFVDFTESSMKSFSTEMIDVADEDVDMVDVDKDVKSETCTGLKSPVGIVNLILTELMSAVRNNWLIEPPKSEKEIEEEKKKQLDRKELDLIKEPKSDVSKNEHCEHIIFLLKVLTELLASYKQSKLEFLTFSKKNLFQEPSVEEPKPRSTSLNFLLHQLILSGKAELPDEELARKAVVGELAVSVIIAFVSTVSGRHVKADPKDVDPDLTFMRKFTVDTIHKVLKESVTTAPGIRTMCARVTSLCLALRSLLSPQEEPYLDPNVIEFDAFHIASVVIDSGLPATLTSILSDIDLNFGDYIFPLESAVNVLSFLGQIKANNQELFRATHPTNGLEEEEVEDDDNDFKEETPDLFQNSTLGMYDVEDIDSEDDFSNDELSFGDEDEDIEEDEDMDDDIGQDIEIVYSEDEDDGMISTDDGETVSLDSDHSSFSDLGSDEENAGSNSSDQYVGYDIAPELAGGSEFDSESESEEYSDASLDIGSDAEDDIEAADDDGWYTTDDHDHDHVFEFDDDDDAESSDEEAGSGHWIVRSGEHGDILDFEDEGDVLGYDDEEEDISDGSELMDTEAVEVPQTLRRVLHGGSRRYFERERQRHGRILTSNIAGNDFIELINNGNIHARRGSSRLNQFYDYFVNILTQRNGNQMPSSHNRAKEEFKILSTKERWTELSLILGSKTDALRIYGHIFKNIYEPSREIYNENQKAEDMKHQKEEEEQKRQAEEEAQRRAEQAQLEANTSNNDEEHEEPHQLDPIWVTVGGRQVDISGTDIDPEFFEALPDDMREDVLTQHIRERRAEASTTGDTGHTREIDEDFLEALPEHIRTEILTQEALSSRLRAVEQSQTVQQEETNVTSDEESKKDKKAKQKVFFTPLLDKYGVASLIRFVFIPQSFPARKSLYMLLGQLCLNKQTRSEVLGLLIAILQDGISSQEALQNVYRQICTRVRPSPTASQGPVSTPSKLGTPRTPSQSVVPKDMQSLGHFPNRASPFVIACQVLEALQFLLESDPQLRYYFITEHDPVLLYKKAGSIKKSHLSGKSSKYPINFLLNLLDIPLVKQKSVLMDGLSRLVQITTRPLASMKKAKEAAEDPSKIELPIITSTSLRNFVTILVSDDCSSRTFQQTLSAMQNLLVLNAHNVFSNELSKLSMKLASSLNKDLEVLVGDLKKLDEEASDFDSQIMQKFTSSSSDQSKLLRVLTALDYLFGREKKDGGDKVMENKELTKLYTNLKLGSLWVSLSDSLDIFEANKSITHVATALLPLIESLMVVCKHSEVKDVQAKDVFNYENSKDFANENIENLFFSFTNEHKKILNQMVRSNPKLMSGPFTMLVKNPKILEFDNKKNYFDRKLHDTETERKTMSISVRRKEVFLDSYRALFFKSKDEFRNAKLEINFKGEAGVDAGGVTREWYQVLSRQMFNPDYALFLPIASDKTTFHPNRTSWVNPEHLSFFKFVGRIIGKAIYDGCFLDCHFTRDVYKSILGCKVSLKDVETIDLNIYKSLTWMLENDITDVIIETFSIEADDYGEKKIIDLIPDGRNIAVTEENKQQYVKKVVEFRVQKSVEEQVENFLQGFYEIIPKTLISIFDEQELELLISGLPDIDVDDWKNNTTYVNYTASSREISYFWRAVRSFDTEERAKLLQFATGTSKVPLNGFKELEGANGATKFNIHKDFGSTDRLPSSHTCFNQIDLPAYDSYEKLRKALLLAINEGHEGFGLA